MHDMLILEHIGGQEGSVNLPGRILYAKLWGSRSHNTALETSDYDFLVVYVAPLQELAGIKRPPESVVIEKPDVQAHEAGKFCDLLLKGNPAQIEMLFTERYQIGSVEWDVLRSERKRFLTQQAIKQYVGYAGSQLHKLATGRSLHTKGSCFNEKWAYHMLRILLDAERIAHGHPPSVWKEGIEKVLLMDVRAGKYTDQQIERMGREKLDKIAQEYPKNLIENPPSEWLNDWLLWVRGLRGQP